MKGFNRGGPHMRGHPELCLLRDQSRASVSRASASGPCSSCLPPGCPQVSEMIPGGDLGLF